MLAIVAHHYVVNSGLMERINESGPMSFPSLFLLLFGCWGKIGINCFVLITGYFMCRSHITLRKFLKLYLEWMFYTIVIYFLFALFGYEVFSLKEVVKVLTPFRTLTDGFTSFGVLCIHANSDAMRRWLWQDVCNNVGFFDSDYLVVHAVGVVLAVFAACVVIDQLRIRFVERPFFKLYDQAAAAKTRSTEL